MIKDRTAGKGKKEVRTMTGRISIYRGRHIREYHERGHPE